MPETKCPVCGERRIPDRNGDCPKCHVNLIPVEKDPNEHLEFYCVVCEEIFRSRRDQTGLDQAPCPKCGDLSNTAEFHAGELARHRRDLGQAGSMGFQIVFQLLLYALGTGALVLLLKQLF